MSQPLSFSAAALLTQIGAICPRNLPNANAFSKVNEEFEREHSTNSKRDIASPEQCVHIGIDEEFPTGTTRRRYSVLFQTSAVTWRSFGERGIRHFYPMSAFLVECRERALGSLGCRRIRVLNQPDSKRRSFGPFVLRIINRENIRFLFVRRSARA